MTSPDLYFMFSTYCVTLVMIMEWLSKFTAMSPS